MLTGSTTSKHAPLSCVGHRCTTVASISPQVRKKSSPKAASSEMLLLSLLSVLSSVVVVVVEVTLAMLLVLLILLLFVPAFSAIALLALIMLSRPIASAYGLCSTILSRTSCACSKCNRCGKTRKSSIDMISRLRIFSELIWPSSTDFHAVRRLAYQSIVCTQ